MKFMLIGFSILGMQVNINVATNDAITLIASKGAVPYEFIRESPSKLSSTAMKSSRKSNVRLPYSLMFQEPETLMVRVARKVDPSKDSNKPLQTAFVQNTQEVVSPIDDSQERFSPISIANRGQEDLCAESLIDRSISPESFGQRRFSLLSLDPTCLSPELAEDEGFFNRREAELEYSDSDDELFKSNEEWVQLEFFESQSSVTVTFTGTNVVKKVPFGRPFPTPGVSVNTMVFQKPVNCPPPTPINKVQRTLRPSTRTDEGRLKEAQINNMLPIKFGIHPTTKGERVLIEQRRPDCLTPFRPIPSRDLTDPPFLRTDQPSQVLPVQMCVSSREHNERHPSENPEKAEAEDSQEVET